MKQVICMKWGTLYGADYVNRLYAMVRANTTGPLRFVCLTDDATGIRAEVERFDCPLLDIPMPHQLRGWRKVSLFGRSEALFGLTGSWLYLDLDTVITGSLDDFFDYEPERTFVVMKNWTQPHSGIGNTSCYRFTVGAHEDVLTRLMAQPMALIKQYRNSQTYISRTITNVQFWPDPWCTTFKVQSVPAWPLRLFKTPTIPQGVKVIAFPGDPNPIEAIRGEWPVKKAYKKLYKYIRPTPWIQDIYDRAEAQCENKST